MQSTALLASIAMLAAIAASPALAGDRDHDRSRQHLVNTRPAGGSGQGMQAVPHASAPGERAHGWQYFSDPSAHRAVVISPQGDYYYSHGKGLRWVAATQTGA